MKEDAFLLYHQAVGIQAHSFLNSTSYGGDPKGKKVLVATSKTAGGLWSSEHAKHRQPGCSFG